MRARDSQRSRVYRMEREAVYPKLDKKSVLCGRPALTLEDCAALADLATERFGVRSLTFNKPHSRRNRGTYHPWNHSITMAPWCQFSSYVLHETAHAIIDAHFGREFIIASHGPEFVAVYLDLLAWYHSCNEAELRAWAALYKVRVAPRHVTDNLLRRVDAWRMAAGPRLRPGS